MQRCINLSQDHTMPDRPLALLPMPFDIDGAGRQSSTTHKMLRANLLVALLSPSAAFYLGQHLAPRPPVSRLSPVVAAAEKHATVIFLRHGQTRPPSFEAEP